MNESRSALEAPHILFIFCCIHDIVGSKVNLGQAHNSSQNQGRVYLQQQYDLVVFMQDTRLKFQVSHIVYLSHTQAYKKETIIHLKFVSHRYTLT